MEILFETMPKDIVYIIQGYTIDKKYHKQTMLEMHRRIVVTACDGRFWITPWDIAMNYILEDNKLYNIWLNDLLKQKKWADPYYYEIDSDDDDKKYSICPIGKCTKAIWDEEDNLCYEHSKSKVYNLKEKVMKQLDNNYDEATKKRRIERDKRRRNA